MALDPQLGTAGVPVGCPLQSMWVVPGMTIFESVLKTAPAADEPICPLLIATPFGKEIRVLRSFAVSSL